MFSEWTRCPFQERNHEINQRTKIISVAQLFKEFNVKKSIGYICEISYIKIVIMDFIVEDKAVSNSKVTLSQLSIAEEQYFKISNCDAMEPFFMSIVSDSNHWLFIASNGGLSAGRKNSDYALFPYYTHDKIIESSEITGSKSIFKIQENDQLHIWEPFSERFEGRYKITRNLYKHIYGHKVIFEEINHDLALTYRYEWSSSNQFGFVRQSTLLNNAQQEVSIEIVDGIQNIMPYGVESDFQNSLSNLIDAYKRNELEKESGLGIYALSAIIVDRAEPSEALKANVAWSLGFDQPKYLVSSLQLKNFRKGYALKEEVDMKGEKGAYFLNANIRLAPNSQKEWMIVANVNQNHAAVVQLAETIKQEPQLSKKVQQDIELGTQRLLQLNAASDGLQLTADHLRDTRHFSNTLFNIMRGGIFDHNYQIEKVDFHSYLAKANKEVFGKFENILQQLPDTFTLANLKDLANQSKYADFQRLCFEYLPLKFSRRHGDPSRPWNKFSINTRSEIDGSKILDYQGNWRDIFQNWEALAHSYPAFMESMIHKFLNATTFDGYNPYRVTKGGFDWETIEADDPWSYIGYWGDHQIIYLLKFLEFIEKHEPKKLESFFDKDLFVYANVPYKIKSYEDILKDSKDTIDFDYDLNTKVRERVQELGADGALLLNQQGAIYKVNFIEKILASILAKLSNFIPEGGIWLNTQRPEWNDANNALVGNGVSMVTLYYLRRFLHFFKTLFDKADIQEVVISEELQVFFSRIVEAFDKHQSLLDGSINDHQRKQVLDAVGQAGSDYRLGIYQKAFSGERQTVTIKELQHFVQLSLQFLEHSIRANRRSDQLFHAYNLMAVENEEEVSIEYLSEMLEGQVAVLSAGYLSSKEALDVLDGMKKSKLFREDQYSYILYPNKNLPGFLTNNTIPTTAIANNSFLQKLASEGQIIEQDVKGAYHFNGNFRNANDLSAALEKLTITEENKTSVLQVYEEVFNHKAFTGRSGTFFGYEGLGSIYWHMVSKLSLAVQECCLKAIEEQESAETIGRLLEHYYEINEGIGVHKPPTLYGAFPTDPYSHTPYRRGAQQPGMTGQVKEDILCRFGELGVFVKDGVLSFEPTLLRKSEFLTSPSTFDYIDVLGKQQKLSLPANSLSFTYCQVPIVYEISDKIGVEVLTKDGATTKFSTTHLDPKISQQVFDRTGTISQIHVYLKETVLR